MTKYETSSARFFIQLVIHLINNAKDIEPVDVNNPLNFGNKLLGIIGYPKVGSEISRSVKGLRDTWIESKDKQPLSTYVINTHKNFEKLYLLRSKRQNNPFLFLDFLNKNSIRKVINTSLKDIFLSFNNASTNFFETQDSADNHVSAICMIDFHLTLLNSMKSKCFFFRYGGKTGCAQFKNGTECESNWPNKDKNYNHECAFIKYRKYFDSIIE
jgi:hypothetical protein